MGSITRPELIMGVLAILALCLWIFGGRRFDATPRPDGAGR